MNAVPSLRTAIVLGWWAAVAAAQWSVVEQQEVEPTNLVGQFGGSIAISGDTALVQDSSFVHVFDIDPSSGSWTEIAFLDGPSGFGAGGVDLSGDTAVVGVPDATIVPPQEGEVHVFERDQSGAWTLTAVLSSPQTVMGFAECVAISGDTIVAGCSGAACVFERDEGGPGAWGLAAVLSDGDSDQSDLGRSVDVDGDAIIAGAPLFELGTQEIGAAFVFQRSSTGVAWNHVATLFGSDSAHGDRFGDAVALAGTAAVVGAPLADHSGVGAAGAAYVFERTGNQWLEVDKVTAASASSGDLFGAYVAMHLDTAVVTKNSNDEQGSFAVLKRDHGGVKAWQAIAELPEPFGFHGAVACSTDAVAVDETLPVNPPGMPGLTFDGTGGVLYGSSSLKGLVFLFSIDTGSGAVMPVGPIGFALNALAFDPAAGVLYGIDLLLEELIRIDPASGAGTSIGPLGMVSPTGLDFDPATGTLYATDETTKQLYTVDVGTGAATSVGNIGFAIRGLAFDSGTGTLFGSALVAGNSQLVAIDPRTGGGTLIGLIGFGSVDGLAMDASTGTLYGSGFPSTLIAIDPLTGTGAPIGKFLVPGNLGNSVHVFAISHASESYCTAGTSASGCTALIAASGEPSASAPSGFAISASGVEGAKDGMFFFGATGVQATPWGNGTSYQCVVPPVKRTGLLAGVGTNGACDGSFARDLNAFWCPGCPVPQANPGAGAMIQTQLWYRDPASTSNQPTSLSDAVESYVVP